MAVVLRRPPLIASRDHFFTLHLPVPDSTFYGISGISPTALTPEQPTSTTTAASLELLFRNDPLPYPESIGPSTALAALVDILSTVVEFRQHCARLAFPAYLPSTESQAFYVNSETERIELKMRAFWARLPEAVRAVWSDGDTAAGDPEMIDRGIPKVRIGNEVEIPNLGWWWGGEAEEVDWVAVGVGYFVVGATLFGAWTEWTPRIDPLTAFSFSFDLSAPEYNPTAMAKRLVEPIRTDAYGNAEPDPRILLELRNLDAALVTWQSSSWFSRSVDYACRGSRLLKVFERLGGNETRRDTPFFAWAAYQLALLDLLSARQVSVNPALSLGMFSVDDVAGAAATIAYFRTGLVDLASTSLRVLNPKPIFWGLEQEEIVERLLINVSGVAGIALQ